MRIVMISRYQGLGDYSLKVAAGLPSEVYLLCEAEAEPRSFGNVRLIPCWSKKTFLSDIVRSVSRLKPDLVCVQHELFLFGSVVSALLMPLLLLRIRLLGVPIVLTMHGVIPTRLLSAAFLREAGLPIHPRIVRPVYRLLLNAILALSDIVLVTERWLESELKTHAPFFGRKIAVLELGVPSDVLMTDKKSAKLEIGLGDSNVALFLGYLAFYKGLETLFDAARILLEQGPEWTVLVAGGRPYRELDGPVRDSQSFGRDDDLPGNIRFAGYVPEEKIPTYLSAADVVVFPHKYLIASSGPLSMAIGAGKSVLLSSEFARMIPRPEPIYGSSPEELARKIANSQNDKGLGTACRALSVDWRRERDWRAVSQTYARICEGILRNRGSRVSTT